MKKHNKIEKRTNKYINKYIEPKKRNPVGYYTY